MSLSRCQRPAIRCTFSILLVLFIGGVVLAKKPPKDDPPPDQDVPVRYRIVEVQPYTPPEVNPDSESVRVNDINDQLLAIGYTSWSSVGGSGQRAILLAVDSANPEQSATFYLQDLVDMPPDWACLSNAYVINDGGLVAGTFCRLDCTSGRFVCDTSGVPPYPIQELPQPDGVSGAIVDMNASGDVLFGFSELPYAVAVRDPQSPRIPNAAYQLKFIPDQVDICTGLNDSLQVVGDIELDIPQAEGETRVFRLVGGEFVLADAFYSKNRWARAKINDAGIVAYAVLAKGGTSNAAIYDTLTGTSEILTSEWSGADDVNSAGQVCGMLAPKTHKEPVLGFVYDPDEGFWHLFDLVYAPDPAVIAAFLEEGGSVYRDFSMSGPIQASTTGFPAMCKDVFILLPEPFDSP